MNHLDYQLEDLIADESFQQYCLGNNQASFKFWNDILIENPDKADLFKRAKKAYYLLNGNLTDVTYHQHYKIFKEKVLQNGDKKQKLRRQTTYPFLYTRPVFAAASLVLCLLAGLGYFYLQNRATTTQDIFTHISHVGEKKSIKLPDGSIVILNNQSELSYDHHFNLKDRRVKLKGEGYFIVNHNDEKPFYVETAQLAIKDLGTKFNVQAYPGARYAETTLIEGSIELTLRNSVSSKAFILKPGQKFRINRIEESKSAVEKDTLSTLQNNSYQITTLTEKPGLNALTETDWVNGVLSFQDDTFEDIAPILTRKYGIEIRFEQNHFKNYRFTGSFEHKTVNQILDALQLSNEFKYRKEGNSIIIY